MQEEGNKVIKLTYSLSLFQRLVNPMDGFALRVLSITIIVSLIFGLIMGGYSFMPMWIFTFIVIFLDILFFRKYLLEMVVTILERDSSRCIIIKPEALEIGHKEPEYWISRKLLKVYKGLAGTNLIRVKDQFGQCIIVSDSVISFSELKKLIEVESESGRPTES